MRKAGAGPAVRKPASMPGQGMAKRAAKSGYSAFSGGEGVAAETRNPKAEGRNDRGLQSYRRRMPPGSVACQALLPEVARSRTGGWALRTLDFGLLSGCGFGPSGSSARLNFHLFGCRIVAHLNYARWFSTLSFCGIY